MQATEPSPGWGESMELGDYVAEFVVNAKATPAIYHYVITRKGSTRIEIWGQTFSDEECRREAWKALQQLQNFQTNTAA
jgi:hypothetical protein